MDTTEREIIVEETFDQMTHLIESGTLNGLDVLTNKTHCTLQFDDGSALHLRYEGRQGYLLMEAGGEQLGTFDYNEVEEEWLEQSSKLPLLTVLSHSLSKKFGATVTLNAA